MPADYVSFVTQLTRLISQQDVKLEELGKHGPPHSTLFVYEASVKDPDFPFRGLGIAASVKDSKHEACRDFLYCFMKKHSDQLVKILQEDESYCPTAARLKNPCRDVPEAAIESNAHGLNRQTKKVQKGSESSEEEEVPRRRHPVAEPRTKAGPRRPEMLEAGGRDFEVTKQRLDRLNISD